MRKAYIIGVLLLAMLLTLGACPGPIPEITPAETTPANGPTPEPEPTTPVPTPVLDYNEICIELSELHPELALELKRLPEISDGVSEEDLEALSDICSLYIADPESRETFDLMMNEGIKSAREYCTPLQALLWLAYDQEFDLDNPLKDYSLEKLLYDAWKNTPVSGNYQSERWQEFDEVAYRLNSPEIIAIYLQDNYTYSYTLGEPEGVKSAEQIFNDKKGACYDHALFAGYCLKKNGYNEVSGLMVRFERAIEGYFYGHVVLVFQGAKDSLYYIIDNWEGSLVHGPFETIKEAAEFSVREQGLRGYAFGDINLDTAKYEAPCADWAVEWSVAMPEPELAADEEELKYDDGTARDYISAQVPYVGGHIVDFSPPATPFTINKVRIAGVLYGEGLEEKTFDLEIWDKNLNILHSATYPYTMFPEAAPTWVEFEVPDVEVTDKFYVHLYTDSPFPGLHIGADDSIPNEHSDVTIQKGSNSKILDEWPYAPSLWFGDKNKVNWMIRVVGTAILPPD
jgi:hypothetical protein